MTKKSKSKPRRGLTDGEFEALVDEGFTPSPPRRKGGGQPDRLPDADFNRLAKEGADPRLSATGAAFNAAMSRCLGVPVAPLTDASARFINDLDAAMREWAESQGHPVRDK